MEAKISLAVCKMFASLLFFVFPPHCFVCLQCAPRSFVDSQSESLGQFNKFHKLLSTSDVFWLANSF